MRRREFLKSVAGSPFICARGWAATQPNYIKITRIAGFDLVSERTKLAGKNSRLDVHGRRAMDRTVRLYTNADIEGTGNCRAEHDPLSNDILIAEGLQNRDGYATIPEVPGFGLKINEKDFAANARASTCRFELRQF